MYQMSVSAKSLRDPYCTLKEGEEAHWEVGHNHHTTHPLTSHTNRLLNDYYFYMPKPTQALAMYRSVHNV